MRLLHRGGVGTGHQPARPLPLPGRALQTPGSAPLQKGRAAAGVHRGRAAGGALRRSGGRPDQRPAPLARGLGAGRSRNPPGGDDRHRRALHTSRRTVPAAKRALGDRSPTDSGRLRGSLVDAGRLPHRPGFRGGAGRAALSLHADHHRPDAHLLANRPGPRGLGSLPTGLSYPAPGGPGPRATGHPPPGGPRVGQPDGAAPDGGAGLCPDGAPPDRWRRRGVC